MEELLKLLYETTKDMRKWQEEYKMTKDSKAWIKKRQNEKAVDNLLFQISLLENEQKSNNKA